MLLAGLERPADTDDERGLMLLQVCVFTLLRCKLRIRVLKLLARHERDAALQLSEALELRVYGLHGVLRVAYGLDYVHDRRFKVVKIAVFGQDDLLPVPLVNVDRVQIVQLIFVTTYGVHVGIQSLAGVEAVALERETLPLRERLHDLGVLVGAQDIKADGALNAV